MSPTCTKRTPSTNGSTHEAIETPQPTAESLLRRVNELAGITPALQPEPSIAPNDSEPLFLAPWEAKIFAMIVSLNRQGHFSWAQWVDFFKIEIETANADRRPTHGPAYFLLWLSAAEKLLVSKGLLLADEYAHTKSAFALEHPHPSIAGLMQEHVVINQGLDAFARFVERLDRHDGTPAELLGIVDFLPGSSKVSTTARKRICCFRRCSPAAFHKTVR